MPQPQQPELRRNGENAAVDDHTKTSLQPVGPAGSTDEPVTRVPEDNEPGHKPERDQDKPDLDAFASKFGLGGDRS
jgi:hypothetical protein